jgi:hypothetical protein
MVLVKLITQSLWLVLFHFRYHWQYNLLKATRSRRNFIENSSLVCMQILFSFFSATILPLDRTYTVSLKNCWLEILGASLVIVSICSVASNEHTLAFNALLPLCLYKFLKISNNDETLNILESSE